MPRNRPLVVFLLLCTVTVLSGCATVSQQQRPAQRYFEPIKKDRFSSQAEYAQALQIATNKCRAAALAQASGVPQPSMPAGNTRVFVQNAPIVVGGPPRLPQPSTGPDASQLIAAMQAGEARRLQSQVAEATFTACMNQQGFVEVPASEIGQNR